MSRAILAIGCGEFDNKSELLPPLPATRDATRIFGAFTNASIGAALPAAPSKVLVNPYREAVIISLQAFFEECFQGEIDPIVFFSGHAKPLSSAGWAFYCRDTNPTNISFTTFTFRELESIWRESKAPRCLLIFDTCYARSARPKGTESKKAGEAVLPPPEPSSTGMVLVWSCSELDEAYADRHRSLFSRLLEEGMAVGFAADPWFRTVRAAAAVRWIRNNQPLSDSPPRLKPMCAELGVTEGLFVSANPRYDPSATPCEGPSVLLQEIRRDEADVTEGLKRICSAAEAYQEGRPRFDERHSRCRHDLSRFLKYDPVTSSEVCILPATAQAVCWAELLAWWRLYLPVLIVSMMFVPPAFPRTGKYGVALICIMLTISFIRIVFRRREWADPRHHFLMVTRDGFFEQSGAFRRALAWSAVSKIDHPISFLPFSYEYSLHLNSNCLDGKINIQGDELKFSRTAAYGGALSVADIHTALQWGHDYERNRWQWLVFAPQAPADSAKTSEAADVDSLLIGVGAYDELARLPAEKDVEELRGVIGGRPLIDPSWPQLVGELEAVFSRSAGRTVLLYFSGHAEVKGDELYLLLRPSSHSNAFATALPIHKLLALQAERNVGELIVLLDCCYSSAAAKVLSVEVKDVRVWFEKLPDDIRGRVSLVAASRIDQESLASRGGSLFTRCLATAAAKACDSSGTLRLSEWYDQASRLLNAYGLGQVSSYFAPCDPGRVLLLKGRAERIGLISEHLSNRAVLNLEGQEKELGRIANNIEQKLMGLSPGVYHLDIKGFVVRSNSKFALENYYDIRRQRWIALGILYSGLAGCIFSLYLHEILRSHSFLLGHHFGFTLFVMLLATLGCLMFIGAGGTEQIYLLVVRAGIVLQLNTHRHLVPAYLITDALMDGSTSRTPMGESFHISDIKLRTRNGEKERIFYETLGSISKNWPISHRDLLAKLSPFLEMYLQDAAAYDSESLITAYSASPNESACRLPKTEVPPPNQKHDSCYDRITVNTEDTSNGDAQHGNSPDRV
jgi:Caspase domain